MVNASNSVSVCEHQFDWFPAGNFGNTGLVLTKQEVEF